MNRRTLEKAGAALFCAALSLALCVARSNAQQYPVKPVRMIIPFAAGGATDTVVRIVATRLPGPLGEQVVIDNRTGAGGLIGTELASQANPDGYTLLATGTPHVIVPHLYRKIPYDTLRDFEPIMQIGSQPYALTVHPSLNVKTTQDLIELAKRQPGKINYASSGNGGAQHLFAAMFVSMAHIDMVHVPYKGSGLARADLLGGQVKVGCLGISSIINQHKAGQLRIIAVTSKQRSPELPDVPSISETLPGYDASLWTGLFAPRGTPALAVKRIHADVAKLLQSAEVKSAFERVGTYVVVSEPREFGEYVKGEFTKWGKVVRDVKLQIN